MSLGVGDPFVSFSDKSYFEISEQDIKEMWENDTLNMVFEERVEPEADAWTNGSEWEDSSDVVLHDRMMSDSGLYKHEHSYSLAEGSGRSRLLLHAASSSSHSSMMAEDDMEKECFPAISMKCEEDSAEPRIVVKGEPVSRSNSPEMEVLQEKSRYLKLNVSSQSLLKHPTVYLTPTKSSYSTRVVLSRADVRMELGNARSVYPLPPTPPSSCTSDCEGNQSPLRAPGSPDDCRRTPKLLCAPGGGAGRQLISTPLISSQPRGATGVLILTEEEKRTLIAEGYPVPTKLPLTKAEERSLKKIRRKIKNKISAQESRRKKKEYMDHLERKVELLVSENVEYRKQLTLLEAANSSLQHQLQQLYEERKKAAVAAAAATSAEDH